MVEGIVAHTEVAVIVKRLAHPLAEGIADSILEVDVAHSLAESVELCKSIILRQALAIWYVWQVGGPVDEELACVEVLEV